MRRVSEFDNKQDHFVPRMYLKRFSVPDEPDKVYVFDKRKPGAGIVKRSIGTVERSRDAYTTEADSYLQRLENTWTDILDVLEGKDVRWLNEGLIDRQASASLREWLAPFVVISALRSRADVRDPMRRLRSPMSNTAVRDLRRVYEQFQSDQSIGSVIAHVNSIEAVDSEGVSLGSDTRKALSKEDLHLVCFDYVWS